MATYASLGGSASSSAIWALCDATSESDSEATNALTSSSYQTSTTFTPGAITIDAIGLKYNALSGTSGTLTVALDLATADVAGTVVSINLTDLPNVGTTANSTHTWIFFKFATPVTLAAATAYGVKVKSSSSTVRFDVSATTNWSRQLRTTTTGAAPVASDKLLMPGEYTGAGTSNTLTTTWDLTGSTTPASSVSFGSTAFPSSIHIGGKGVCTFGSTASTNYGMTCKSLIYVGSGGILNTGTIGTPIPSTSTVTITLASATNVDAGIKVATLGAWNGRGNALTTVWDKLAADAAAAATSLTTVNTTGWKNGDVVCIAPTTRTATESESKALGADASGTSIPTIAALTNAHSGTNSGGYDTRAEIGNLTRNVKITGSSSSLQGYVFWDTTAAIDIQYVEFTFLGSATASKRGIDDAVTTGTVNFQYNSIHDNTVVSSLGLNISSTTGNNQTISNNVVYNNHTDGITIAATNSVHVVDSNMVCKNTAGSGGINSADAACTITNNYVSGCVSINISVSEGFAPMGTFTGNVAHSSNSQGIAVSSLSTVTNFSNNRVWRNNSSVGGLVIGMAGTGVTDFTFDSVTAFGNNIAGISINSRGFGSVLFTNCVINAGTTLTQASGFNLIAPASDFFFENCTFGVTNAHATGDISINSAGLGCRMYFRNCTMASSTEVVAQTSMSGDSFISSQRHDQTAGLHKTWSQYGTLLIDTTIYNTASPSLRMTPNNASNKLASAPLRRGMLVPVANGQSITASVYIRKSVIGDGTAYNGNQPRLIVRKNVPIGIASDTVLATYASAAGSWNQISGATSAATDDGAIELIVDADGTQGWINVDDWGAA